MSGQFKRELRWLPVVLMEISYTEDNIILKSLVSYYHFTEDTHLRF